MDLDKEAAARRFAALTWRRDFRRDEVLKTSAFETEISHFTTCLRSGMEKVASELHPSHTVNLDITSTFAVFVREKSSRRTSPAPATPLVACYINTASVGVLSLQFFVRGQDEETMQLTFDCYGRNEYGWCLDENVVFSNAQLAEFILQRVCEIGGRAIVRDYK
jgi:hypothetical protein